jgi:hypothetical protein
MKQRAQVQRRQLHPDAVIDGRGAHGPTGRWRRRLERLLVSNREREEADIERLLAQ